MSRVRIIGKCHNGARVVDVDFGVYETEQEDTPFASGGCLTADRYTSIIAQFGEWDKDHVRFYSPYHIYYLYHTTADTRKVLPERCQTCPITYESDQCIKRWGRCHLYQGEKGKEES